MPMTPLIKNIYEDKMLTQLFCALSFLCHCDALNSIEPVDYISWCNMKTIHKNLITLVGTEPHPTETRQSMRVSGHKSCASLMANIVGLFATIAPSCQRFASVFQISEITVI